ncbi:tRNA (adenosine(37)-N6)-threonylcarbamoyltransferase complex transferase subunit TsaD [Patescibacteria group bacterium]|nr:MAG: tRNA (adenosine(37)-N6)-threonylcarbamoyltransferase complex transferase subunit TsaD [Patescibacteria group bacterium]
MILLSIETSCDETAVSILQFEEHAGETTVTVLGNALFSQVDIHKEYGGVFPMLAKREHCRNLIPLMKKALKEAGLEKSNNQKTSPNNQETITKQGARLENIKTILERESELLEQFLEYIPTIEKPAIDAIAVTHGPGLEPALWVGVSFAKALATFWNIPIIPTNHMEGHVAVALLEEKFSEKNQPTFILKQISYPALALLISGGHTELVLMPKTGEYQLVGQTRDDALGEAFDKVARILGLPYPGGPEISKLAQKDRKLRPDGTISEYILPRPMIYSKDFDFSFSGIKTAVLYMVQKILVMTPDIQMQIARQFEDAVTEVIISKTKKALEHTGAQTLILGGGVVANTHIRKSFENLTETLPELKLQIPRISHTTDNAIMIGITGYHRYMAGVRGDTTTLKAEGNLRLSK